MVSTDTTTGAGTSAGTATNADAGRTAAGGAVAAPARRSAGAERGSDADARRRRGLRRMRAVALSLLVLAAVVYALTRGRSGGWGYLSAAAEASMVGALADWFAVTALFRRPLGLPIPHTAIIPTRKEALGKSLEEFVAENFLAEDVVREKIISARLSLRVGEWLVNPAHSSRVVGEAARLVRGALGVLNDADVTALVQQAILPRVMKEPVSELLGHLLGEIVADGAHHGLVDLAADEAHRFLSEHEHTIADAVAGRAPWWTPSWIDDRVTGRIQREALTWLQEIRDQPEHPARKAIDDLLGRLADDLQHDEATMARAEALKVRVLTHPQVEPTITSLWAAIRRGLTEAVDDPDGMLRHRGVTALETFGRRLHDDAGLRSRLDGYAADAVGYVASSFGPEIATVISDTVNRWDGKEAADKIELHVGRDLQFIRINGTIVGGLAGLAIYAVSTLL